MKEDESPLKIASFCSHEEDRKEGWRERGSDERSRHPFLPANRSKVDERCKQAGKEGSRDIVWHCSFALICDTKQKICVDSEV